MSVRIKRYYCPKCEQFKNSFQVTNVDAFDFDNCKCCGTKCIDTESLLEAKIRGWVDKLKEQNKCIE